VKFIDVHTRSIDLVRKSQAVATVTGTAGWEALFQEKPVLVFGYSYYQYAPGVHRVTSKEECALALRKIISGERPSRDEMRKFLYAVQLETFRGFIEPRFSEVLGMSTEQNSHNLTSQLACRIREEHLSVGTKVGQ
jgi:capsule polysaccharide export protein KpsC/LpsZ